MDAESLRKMRGVGAECRQMVLYLHLINHLIDY